MSTATEPIQHLKPAVDPGTLTWRNLRRDAFWQQIPAWKDVDEATFCDVAWQEKYAITSPQKLIDTVKELASPDFIADFENGLHRAPMTVRLSPYVIALIDWTKPYEDPLRRQFLPLASQLLPDHPMLTLDSLHEQADAPVPGLTHRYVDKALFLAHDICPVYCRFCTRSYAVGTNTDSVEKVNIRANADRWGRAFQYVSERPEVEDVVVSGGDSYRLRADQILEIGNRLLELPNVRRFRFATKGLAIQPMKILSDPAWLDAVTTIAEKGRKLRKEVCIHTHFNHPNEVTGITEEALGLLFERGITVRNQTVFLAGVNDDARTMTELVRRLAYVNVHPYYVYVHDLVRGTEDLRTPLQRALDVEKQVRGSLAGFNTPLFVVDAPGGGGKRNAHSYEHYDRRTGVSVFTAPSVKPGAFFPYFDPIRSLDPAVQADWQDPVKAKAMVEAAVEAARKGC